MPGTGRNAVEGLAAPIWASYLFQAQQREENGDFVFRLSWLILSLLQVVSFQIQLTVDLTMRKPLKVLRHFSSHPFREPRCALKLWLTQVPLKSMEGLQDQALPAGLALMALCLGLEAIECLCHQDAANKCRRFLFNEHLYKDLINFLLSLWDDKIDKCLLVQCL